MSEKDLDAAQLVGELSERAALFSVEVSEMTTTAVRLGFTNGGFRRGFDGSFVSSFDHIRCIGFDGCFAGTEWG